MLTNLTDNVYWYITGYWVGDDMGKGTFLYSQLYEALKKRIKSGEYASGALLPSEREISVEFQVERGTVRKALELLVQDHLVEKRPGIGTRVASGKPQGASAIPSGKRRIIGLIMADSPEHPRKLSQPYYADLFSSLEEECSLNNCQLIYSSVHHDRELSDFMKSHDFLSMVFVTRTHDSWLHLAKKMNVPIILVNERREDLLSISYNNLDGAYMAISEFVKHGHRNIGIIAGPQDYYTTREKMAGCYQAIVEYGLRVPQENIVYGDWEYQSGVVCARRLFADRSRQERPTAIFAFNDMMCVGAIRALRELSLSIPKDVSIMGFDNMNQLKYTEPGLTTIDTNVSLMAKVILECATTHFGQTTSGLKIQVPVQMVHRETVGAAR